jgi:hypothetical protein
MFNEQELAFFDSLEKEGNGYYAYRKIETRGICCLNDFMFTTGIIVGLTSIGYYGRYCYPNKQEAIDSFNKWDGQGDPPGNWVKYKGEGGERSNLKCNDCKEPCNKEV